MAGIRRMDKRLPTDCRRCPVSEKQRTLFVLRSQYVLSPGSPFPASKLKTVAAYLEV
jgi:hypothetical protein